MKRKTAMMDAIEKYQHALAYNVEGRMVEPYSWTEFSTDMHHLLEKEKEQIMDAADVCLEKSGTEPEEYYNEIYKQEEESNMLTGLSEKLKNRLKNL